jgi:hypothetical protein
MPLPVLPLDIVSEVLSHFHLDTQISSPAQVAAAQETGISVSLVCRNWSPLGQALRWRHLALDAEEVPMLLKHFQAHPHLADLPKSLDALSSQDEVGREGEGQGGSGRISEEAYDSTLELLGQLSDLRDIRIPPQWGRELDQIVVRCSKYQRLESLELHGSSLSVSARVKSALISGYPALKSLLIATDVIKKEEDSQGSHEEEETTEDTKSQVQQSQLTRAILLANVADKSVVSSFFELLKTAFDWSSTGKCVLGGRFIQQEIFLDLARQPLLDRMALFADTEESFAENFTMLTTVLPQLTSIEALQLSLGVEAEEPLVPSISIWDFLDLIPESLKDLRIGDIDFDPDDFYEFYGASDFRRKKQKCYRKLQLGRLELYEYDTREGKQWCQ